MNASTIDSMSIWVVEGRTFADTNALAEVIAESKPGVPLETIRTILDLPDGLKALGFSNASKVDAQEALAEIRDQYKRYTTAVKRLASERQALITEMIVRGVPAKSIILASGLPASTIIGWFTETERDADGKVVKELQTVRVGNKTEEKLLPVKYRSDERLSSERMAEFIAVGESLAKSSALAAKLARKQAKAAA